MSIIAKQQNESNFSPIPEGVHTAVCYSIVDLGMQHSELYNKSTRKVMITWELPEEVIQVDGEDKPRAISKEYSLSLSDKATLRKDLQAWRGKAFTDEELEGFDLKNVMNKGCQLQIIHTEKNGKTYSNIASIMGLPKGMRVNPPSNESICFDMSEDGSLELLSKLPQWIQDKIKVSETYRELTAHINAGQAGYYPNGDDSDLPF